MLLLDEMLPPSIAVALTRAGCDTLAVSADPELRGTADADVLERAAAHGRVLVTDNVRDFVPLSNAWNARGRAHSGLLLVSSNAFPMTSGRGGSITAALLRRHATGAWPAPGQFEFL